METRIIGVDCATKQKKIGLALGEIVDGKVHVNEATLCSENCTALMKLTEWIGHDRSRRTLIAMDAPLGWPQPFGAQLSTHVAGGPIPVNADVFFRRVTDRFVRKQLGKTPLDVGADRIARTAHSALSLLSDLREELDLAIPLAWNAQWDGAAAIEVYPAATLESHGLSASGYKENSYVSERKSICQGLQSYMHLPDDCAELIKSADVLDAAVCVLAAGEFLIGNVHQPINLDLAKKEGWIWFTKNS